jgi:hypothetical protein
MAENRILDTVIILRNDQTTAWEDANAYTLEPGEVGIGRLTRADGSEVVIAKVGNGADTWQDLPQIEGVLESDITLTYNFGRHKTANGSVDAGGKGMTMSEWLIDALSEVVRPKVNAPYTSLSAKAYIEGSTTAATSAEIGSRITALVGMELSVLVPMLTPMIQIAPMVLLRMALEQRQMQLDYQRLV